MAVGNIASVLGGVTVGLQGKNDTQRAPCQLDEGDGVGLPGAQLCTLGLIASRDCTCFPLAVPLGGAHSIAHVSQASCPDASVVASPSVALGPLPPRKGHQTHPDGDRYLSPSPCPEDPSLGCHCRLNWQPRGCPGFSGRLCPVTLPHLVPLQATLNCPPVVWGLGLQLLLMPPSRWASIPFMCFICTYITDTTRLYRMYLCILRNKEKRILYS